MFMAIKPHTDAPFGQSTRVSEFSEAAPGGLVLGGRKRGQHPESAGPGYCGAGEAPSEGRGEVGRLFEPASFVYGRVAILSG